MKLADLFYNAAAKQLPRAPEWEYRAEEVEVTPQLLEKVMSDPDVKIGHSQRLYRNGVPTLIVKDSDE